MSDEQKEVLRPLNVSIEEYNKRLAEMHEKNKTQNKPQKALELRRSLQIFLSTLDPDVYMDQMLEVPSVFPKYDPNKTYPDKTVVSYGVNNVGDPQLYQIKNETTVAATEVMKTRSALPFPLVPIGTSDDGIAKWIMPLGKPDCYNTGDIVDHDGKRYESMIDENMDIPGTNDDSWKNIGGN